MMAACRTVRLPSLALVFVLFEQKYMHANAERGSTPGKVALRYASVSGEERRELWFALVKRLQFLYALSACPETQVCPAARDTWHLSTLEQIFCTECLTRLDPGKPLCAGRRCRAFSGLESERCGLCRSDTEECC